MLVETTIEGYYQNVPLLFLQLCASITIWTVKKWAGGEMADARALGARGAIRVGSSPTLPTRYERI